MGRGGRSLIQNECLYESKVEGVGVWDSLGVHDDSYSLEGGDAILVQTI